MSAEGLGKFIKSTEPVHLCWTECKVCGMSGLGGIDWYRQHQCPEPYPRSQAQALWNSLLFPGNIIHPKTRARLQMSWWYGYIQPREGNLGAGVDGSTQRSGR